MVMCCSRQRDSGIPTGVAFAVGGTQVAVVNVVRKGRCGRVLDCMASAVALELVGEPDTVHATVVR